MNLANHSILTHSLKHVREEMLARARLMGINQVMVVSGVLKQHAMDFNKAYPTPNSWNTPRAQYRMAEALRAHAKQFVDRVPAEDKYTPNPPYIVTMKPDADDIGAKNYEQAALASFGAYVVKLTGKIGEAEIKSATVTGSLWDGSTLVVEMADGTKQVWTTKCILNESVYGKLFNQWVMVQFD